MVTSSTTKPSIDHLWRNDITGLRAVAVLPVLLFHAFPSLLPGGFFGVDVFFVISGYLISGIIFRGMIKGSFSYRNFYEKRIKRILPNLLLLLVAVCAAGYFFLLDKEYENLGKHIYSSAAFIQNFRLLSEIGYFTEDALRKPLLHLWSLAIEEQFYIIFPIICTLIWRFSRSQKIIGSIVFFITIASLLACLLIENKSYTFYFPLTRFWELGCGIVLAYFESYGLVRPKRIHLGLRHAMSFLGLMSIVVPMFIYTKAMVHPGYITLLPVLGSVSLIMAQPDAIINRTLLSWAPMTFVGLISYSLYLWHWPLLAYIFICIPEASAGWMIGALALSFVLATLVYYFVENPVRISKGWGKLSTTMLLLLGLILAFGMGQLIRDGDGFPNRPISKQYPELAHIRDGMFNRDSLPTISYNETKLYVTNIEAFPSILYAGDSHVEQYHLRLKRLGKQHDTSVGMLTRGGCFILNTKSSNEDCKLAAQTFYKLLEDSRIKTVVIGNKWGGYSGNETEFKAGLNQLKDALKSRPNLKAFVLLDAPWDEGPANTQGSFDPYKHFNRANFKLEDFILPYPKMDLWKKGNDFVATHLTDFATIISIESIVCPEGKCNLLKWYRDDDHLQPRRIEEEGTWLDQTFVSIH